MECKCKAEMKLIGTFDNPFPGDGCNEYAYNLYKCECGIVAKHDVWHLAGITWIHLDGKIEKAKKVGQ